MSASEPSVREKDSEVRRVRDGFDFLEGPVWDTQRNHLLFSDIRGNTMYVLKDGELSVYRKPSNMANGNTLDRSGRLITCEHATSRVTRTEADGRMTVLASHFEDTELNSPNDVVVRSDGMIFFTDPDFGRGADYGVERDVLLGHRGVYMVDPRSLELTCISRDFDEPNGLCFLDGEKTLLVDDSTKGHIRALDIEGDETTDKGVWATTEERGEGLVDGLKVDSEGNVFCCGPGGVHVFDVSGSLIDFIAVPEVVANLTWGDADLRTLYLTASTSLYSVRVRNPGIPLN